MAGQMPYDRLASSNGPCFVTQSSDDSRPEPDGRLARAIEPHEETSAPPRCPGCLHSLVAAPSAGRCPECGHTYRDDDRFAYLKTTSVVGLVALGLWPLVLLPFAIICAVGSPRVGVPLIRLFILANSVWVGHRLVLNQRVRRLRRGDPVAVAGNALQAFGCGLLIAALVCGIGLGLCVLIMRVVVS